MNAGDSNPPDRELSLVRDPAEPPDPDARADALQANIYALRDDAEEAAEESMQYFAVRVIPILLGVLALVLVVRRRRSRRRTQPAVR